MAQDESAVTETRTVTIPDTAAAARLDRILADELADNEHLPRFDPI